MSMLLAAALIAVSAAGAARKPRPRHLLVSRQSQTALAAYLGATTTFIGAVATLALGGREVAAALAVGGLIACGVGYSAASGGPEQRRTGPPGQK